MALGHRANRLQGDRADEEERAEENGAGRMATVGTEEKAQKEKDNQSLKPSSPQNEEDG